MSNEMSENTSEPNPEWERFKRDESEFVDKLLDPMCRASFDDDNPASVAYRNMMLAMFAMTWLIRESGERGEGFSGTFKDMVVGGAALVLGYFQHPELYEAEFVDLLDETKKSLLRG